MAFWENSPSEIEAAARRTAYEAGLMGNRGVRLEASYLSTDKSKRWPGIFGYNPDGKSPEAFVDGKQVSMKGPMKTADDKWYDNWQRSLQTPVGRKFFAGPDQKENYRDSTPSSGSLLKVYPEIGQVATVLSASFLAFLGINYFLFFNSKSVSDVNSLGGEIKTPKPVATATAKVTETFQPLSSPTLVKPTTIYFKTGK